MRQATRHGSRLLTISALLMLLTACGFHLRNQGEQLPPHLTTLAVSSGAPEAERLLRADLVRRGATLSDAAPLTLVVVDELINRQSSVLDPRAQAAERTIFYELSFQLRHASGIAATPVRQIRLRRQFQFDNTRIVGKFEEENLLIDDLRQQAVGQLLTQLGRANPASLLPDVAPPPPKPGDLIPRPAPGGL